MVSIIPIEVEDDLIREGLQYAIAARLASALRKASDAVANLESGGCVDRDEWQQVFAEIATQFANTEPVMEYAKCFNDQWPDDEYT